MQISYSDTRSISLVFFNSALFFNTEKILLKCSSYNSFSGETDVGVLCVTDQVYIVLLSFNNFFDRNEKF